MATTKNRFAMLCLDDDSSDEGGVEQTMAEQAPVPVPVPVAVAPRTWSLQEGKPERTRDWNLESEKNPSKRGPFSRYAFRDDNHPSRIRPPRTYAFRDDSPPPETQKPVTPVTPCYAPPSPVPPPVEEMKLSEEEFPKLTDHIRPMTPPYPPDDGYYPTLAQRIRDAMEKKAEEPSMTDKKTINMDTVIPMPTRLSKNLGIE